MFYKEGDYEKVWSKLITPSKLEQREEELKNMGIEQVHCFDSLGIDFEYQEKLTLIVLPLIKDTIEDTKNVEEYITNILGLKIKEKHYITEIKTEDIVTSDDLFVFYKTKNVIVSKVNVFREDKFMKELDFFINYKVEKVTLEEANYLKLEKEYIKRFKEKLKTLEGDIEHMKDRVKDYAERHLESLKELHSLKLNKELLSKGEEEIAKKFSKEIEEIKKLPMVEELTVNDNLEVMFKPTYITAKIRTGEEDKEGVIVPIMENKRIYIGKLKFFIKENSVTVRNLDNERNGYAHPHAGSSMCFGVASTQLNELLASFELKKLIQLLYSWSLSYNEDDTMERIEVWYKDKEDEE